MLRRKRKKTLPQVVFVLLAVIVVVSIFSYFFIYRPASAIYARGTVLAEKVNEMKAVIKENDIDLVKNKFGEIEKEYSELEKVAQRLYWAAFIPYIADMKNGIEAGDYVLAAGKKSIDAIYPYADLIGFKKGESSFVDKSAEDRLATAVLTLDKVLAEIDTISKNIDEAEKRIEKIEPNRYPEEFGGKKIRENLIVAKEQFTGLASLFVNAKPLLKNLPKMLGKEREMTYLVLFQNDKEQRATGGFLTAYAVLKINQGRITIESSEDIYDLDNSIALHPPAPEKIRTYHLNVPTFNIRDSNLSPDFVESIKLFNSLYEKSAKKVDYDAIVAVDTKILVDMLTIFGPTEAAGVTFTANQDDRCDCPQVIYELSNRIGRPVGFIKTDRKGLLGDLVYALFYKAIGFSPSKYWGTLAQTMFKNLDEKHILLYFTDTDIQAAAEQLNYAGRIRNAESDYLHVNNVNFAGAKSNLFVTKNLVTETKFEGNEIKRTVTVEFKNPYKHSDCNLERGGLCLNATLRNWIRVYVPKGSKLVSFRGSTMKTKTYDELDKTVFEGFLSVPTEGKASVNLEFILPASISKEDYNLFIQKQPGEQTMTLDVNIDNKNIYKDLFITDKTFE